MGNDPSDTKAMAAPYIEDMSVELATLARKDNLPTLAYLLDMAAAEARNHRIARRYRRISKRDTDWDSIKGA